MELDLYQRRGMLGLGVCGDGTDPVLDLTCGGTAVTAPVTSALSSLTSGIDVSSMSPTTLLVAGAFGLWVLSSLFSGGKRAYGKVARPIKKRRKQKRDLEEAEEQYESKKKRIKSGKSSSRGGGGFF
jgi:hypothetical protein